MSSRLRTSTESAQLIAAYFLEQGRMPAASVLGSGEQKRLALALARLRSLNRQGKLPETALLVLNDASLSWATRASSHGTGRLWQVRVDELAFWVDQHGRTPRRNSINPTERALAQWVIRYRSHALHGRHLDRIQELDSRVPNWRQPSNTRIDRFVAWVNSHGRTPRLEAADPTERSLAAWWKRYRDNASRGRHPNRVNEVKTRLHDSQH